MDAGAGDPSGVSSGAADGWVSDPWLRTAGLPSVSRTNLVIPGLHYLREPGELPRTGGSQVPST